MRNLWNQIKGWVAVVTGFIACPCHLPVTLPLLIALTAGTAFSAWLASNVLLVAALSTLYFIAAMVLGFRWLNQGAQPVPDLGAGPLNITLVTSPTCQDTCENARAVWHQVHENYPIHFEEVTIVSPRGRELAAKYNFFTTPVSIVNEKFVMRGVPPLNRAMEIVQGANASNARA